MSKIGSRCHPKEILKDRKLIGSERARSLAELFEVLSNDTRLRILHAIVREDVLCVTDLASRVGMKPQAVSNQLRKLSDKGILSSTRQGNEILYRINNPCVTILLDRGLCLLEETTPSIRDKAAIKKNARAANH